jgi:hypothetical protein
MMKLLDDNYYLSLIIRNIGASDALSYIVFPRQQKKMSHWIEIRATDDDFLTQSESRVITSYFQKFFTQNNRNLSAGRRMPTTTLTLRQYHSLRRGLTDRSPPPSRVAIHYTYHRQKKFQHKRAVTGGFDLFTLMKPLADISLTL